MPDCVETAAKCRFFLFLLVCTTYHVSAGIRQRDRAKSSSLKISENVCEIESSSGTVHCYCDNQEYQQAIDSNCWIFAQVRVDDAIWDHFISQSNIERLKFNIRPDVNLNFVPTKALSHLKRLKEFKMQYANIMDLPEYTFANLSSLEEVLMARNQIINLKPHSFYGLQNLSSISLDENRIEELNRDVFMHLPNLKKLYIARNILKVIHDRTFEHLHQLEELELTGNQLSDITHDTFIGLKQLRILNLQENQIGALRDFTFSELPNLRELNMDRNEIKSISDKTFEGLSSLDRLTLSENKLTSLSNDLFTGLANLRVLDLRENSLRTLDYATVDPIMENLKNVTAYFSIEGNKFVCDCHLSWMYLLRNETPNDQIRNTLDELTCELVYSPMEDSDQNGNSLGDDFEDIQQDGQLSSKTKHLFDIPQEQLPCEEEELMEQDPTASVPLTVSNEMNMGTCVHITSIVYIFCLFVVTF